MIPRVEKHGEEFWIAFGVDDFDGPFCHVWKVTSRRDVTDRVQPVVKVDDTGVFYRPSTIRRHLGAATAERAIDFLERLKEQRRIAVDGRALDHVAAVTIFRFFGFPDLGRELAIALGP